LPKDTNEIKFFKEDNSLSIKQGGGCHKLLIGDNYDALNNLLITHRNKINVIYIDPPYGCNSMGEFAKTNYENKISRDNLLSMLKPRLLLAKQLLSDDGVIFCSIDDKNQAHLKLLFDDVFGESNFVCNFIRRTNAGGKNDKKNASTDHEYILCYAKTTDIEVMNGFLQDESSYKLKDENYDKYGKYKLSQMCMGGLTWTKTLDFPITAPDGSKIFAHNVTEKEWENRLQNHSTNDWC
jgi:adenine-specific DNA-methyltransferase